MAGDPAEVAYGHALAMLGDPDAAAEVAITALRRAGRTRRLVLAHARYQAVTRALLDAPVELDNLQSVVLDLPALAATLASTRPPDERAALDVRARAGGNLVALGEALGMRPSAAAKRCAEIAELWEATLDPALLAFAGAGDCEELAGILEASSPTSVSDLLAIAGTVKGHANGCVACSDRTRAMNSVRSFFSSGVVDVPATVREASVASRRLRPSADPPPLFTDETAIGRLSRVVTVSRFASVVGVLIALASLWVALDRRDRESKVATLTHVAAASGITFDAPSLATHAATLTIRNTTNRPIAYRVSVSVDWLRVTPAHGMIAAQRTRSLTASVLDSAPEGDSRVTLTVTTASGATSSHEMTWTVNRPPDLAATAVGCTVSVNVVEEGELVSLVLHWTDTTEHQLDITSGPEGYEAMLDPQGHTITYWVTATDARGNQARTPDQTIPAGAC